MYELEKHVRTESVAHGRGVDDVYFQDDLGMRTDLRGDGISPGEFAECILVTLLVLTLPTDASFGSLVVRPVCASLSSVAKGRATGVARQPHQKLAQIVAAR